ncbi:hypothetical protein OSTOST_09776, partial [Ostertagia ostertagi]
MADREKPQKKGGILSRLRDTSHSRKKDAKSKDDKSGRLSTGKANWRSFDSASVDAASDGAPPTGQKDVLASADMPSSGPGRQLTIRKSSMKKKKKTKVSVHGSSTF